MSGLSLPHAMPCQWQSERTKNPISEDLKAFYEYHSILMEPFGTVLPHHCSGDGRFAGGMFDRNGLRPACYTITKNDMMVVASRRAMDFDPTEIAEKGRLQPVRFFLIDTQEGKIYYDGGNKERLAHAHPYRQWLSTKPYPVGETEKRT